MWWLIIEVFYGTGRPSGSFQVVQSEERPTTDAWGQASFGPIPTKGGAEHLYLDLVDESGDWIRWRQ